MTNREARYSQSHGQKGDPDMPGTPATADAECLAVIRLADKTGRR
jgi:hypothetical protein